MFLTPRLEGNLQLKNTLGFLQFIHPVLRIDLCMYSSQSTSWYSKLLPSDPNSFFCCCLFSIWYPSMLCSCHINLLSFLSPPCTSKSWGLTLSYVPLVWEEPSCVCVSTSRLEILPFVDGWHCEHCLWIVRYPGFKCFISDPHWDNNNTFPKDVEIIVLALYIKMF